MRRKRYMQQSDMTTFDPAKTVHLAIDVQDGYFHPDMVQLPSYVTDARPASEITSAGEEIASRIASLGPVFNKAGLAQNIWVTHAWVPYNLYMVRPESRDRVMMKPHFSAFKDTKLNDQLQAAGIENVVISGGMLSKCVRQTARDALALGYNVVVLDDCVHDVTPLQNQQRLKLTFGVSAEGESPAGASVPIRTAQFIPSSRFVGQLRAA